MQQKIISRAFLIIGINLFCISCGKTFVSYVTKGEFKYTNKVNVPISINLYGKVYNSDRISNFIILPGETKTINTRGESDFKVANYQMYIPAITGDTTTISFDTLCYSEYHYKGKVLQNINSYKWVKNGDREFTFYLDIDSNILKLATKCQ